VRGPGSGGALLSVEETGRPFETIEDILNRESGLKGICGMNDMREIQRRR